MVLVAHIPSFAGPLYSGGRQAEALAAPQAPRHLSPRADVLPPCIVHKVNHQLTEHTTALVKAIGMIAGECVFGLFGPFLFIHTLSWFEINEPCAVVIGVMFGAAVGYAAAELVLHVLRRERPVRHLPRGAMVGPDLTGAHT
jgi:hypothetical protein